MAVKKQAITEKALTMLNYLKENAGVQLLNTDIAAGLGITPQSVTGSVNGLVKRELAERVPASIEVNGEVKAVKFIKITDAGMAYDHEAALAADAEAAAKPDAE